MKAPENMAACRHNLVRSVDRSMDHDGVLRFHAKSHRRHSQENKIVIRLADTFGIHNVPGISKRRREEVRCCLPRQLPAAVLWCRVIDAELLDGQLRGATGADTEMRMRILPKWLRIVGNWGGKKTCSLHLPSLIGRTWQHVMCRGRHT